MLMLFLIASIQLKTVWEKTFTEPVVDVFFESGKPMIVVTRNFVRVLDKEGNEKIKIPYLSSKKCPAAEGDFIIKRQVPLIAIKKGIIFIISEKRKKNSPVLCEPLFYHSI